jgi:hypothetical protein
MRIINMAGTICRLVAWTQNDHKKLFTTPSIICFQHDHHYYFYEHVQAYWQSYSLLSVVITRIASHSTTASQWQFFQHKLRFTGEHFYLVPTYRESEVKQWLETVYNPRWYCSSASYSCQHSLVILSLQEVELLLDPVTRFPHGELEWLAGLRRSLEQTIFGLQSALL